MLITLKNCLVITYWERADLLALLYVMFYCVFVIFPFDVTGQVWNLILLIPDFAFFITLLTMDVHFAY